MWLWILAALATAGGGPVLAQTGAPAPAPAPAAASAPPAGSPGTPAAEFAPAAIGEAQVVAGNLASAKKRALESALVALVEMALTPLLTERGLGVGAPEPPALAGLRGTVRAGARRFVRSYRIVAEEALPAPNPRFRIQVEGDVDAVALRRAVDGALSTGAPVPGGAVGVDPGGAPVVLAGDVSGEMKKQLALILARGGLRVLVAADAPPARTLAEARAARPGPAAAWVWLADQGTSTGPVRGADQQAGQCQLQASAFNATGDAAAGSVVVAEHGFATTAGDALRACEIALAAASAARLAPLIAAATAGRGPVARAQTAWFFFEQPPLLDRLQIALSKIGAITSAELRRVAVGQAEFRLHTELNAAALGPLVARELGKQFAAELLPAQNDGVHLRIGLLEPLPAAPPVAP